MDTLLLGDTTEDIKLAADIIKKGGLVAFPTETVYGLGANALNRDAVRKIYEAKGRPSDNPMIVHLSSANDILTVTRNVTEDMKKLMDNFWPGPMTMVVPRLKSVPDVTTGGLDTVGIRVPSNETACKLILFSGCPIAAPSANLSGKPSPTRFEHVKQDMMGRVDAIIKGTDSDIGIESSVIDMTSDNPVILRPGKITKSMFESVLGKEVFLDSSLLSANFKEKPKAPGMKYRHYAPNAKMYIYDGERDKVETAIELEKSRLESLGKKVCVMIFEDREESASEVAKQLFSKLREADDNSCDVILASAIPTKELGFSVMNRMLKAAGNNVIKIV